MAVSVLATRLNNLQNRLRAIYGDPATPSSTTGYGQTTRSSQVANLVFVPKNFNAVTSVDYASNTITITGHNIPNKEFVEYDANGNTPIVGNLVEDAHYYVQVIDANTIQLYYDIDLTDPVDLVSGSTGTHILNHLDGDLAAATEFFNLYLDIASCRIHQAGTAYVVPNSATIIAGDLNTEQYLTDLETLMTAVETNYGNIDSNALSLQNLKDGTGTDIQSTRTTAWNGTITHEFNMNFADVGDRTAYFNAGGDVRLDQSLTGGSGLKTDDWRNILNNAGTIIFSASGTSRLNQGPGGSVTAVTPYSLTSTYQTIFTISGASYVANEMDIAVKTTGTSSLAFRIRFRDLDTGGDGLPGGTFGPDPVDENVNGTINSSVSITRPASTLIVGGVTYDAVRFDPTGINTITL